MSKLVTLLLLFITTLAAMHFAARLVARQSSALFGRRTQLYLFGMLGTIVHEGSHVLACLLFGHRVHRVKWFDPLATDGSLGLVEHSYNPASTYQRIGTIVIGIAPLLVGAAVILFTLPTHANAEWWRWALFGYVSISVGGSMHLSRADMRGMWRGVLTVALISLAVAALVAVMLYAAPNMFSSLHGSTMVAKYGDQLTDALVLAVLINACTAALLFVLVKITAR